MRCMNRIWFITIFITCITEAGYGCITEPFYCTALARRVFSLQWLLGRAPVRWHYQIQWHCPDMGVLRCIRLRPTNRTWLLHCSVPQYLFVTMVLALNQLQFLLGKTMTRPRRAPTRWHYQIYNGTVLTWTCSGPLTLSDIQWHCPDLDVLRSVDIIRYNDTVLIWTCSVPLTLSDTMTLSWLGRAPECWHYQIQCHCPDLNVLRSVDFIRYNDTVPTWTCSGTLTLSDTMTLSRHGRALECWHYQIQ